MKMFFFIWAYKWWYESIPDKVRNRIRWCDQFCSVRKFFQEGFRNGRENIVPVTISSCSSTSWLCISVGCISSLKRNRTISNRSHYRLKEIIFKIQHQIQTTVLASWSLLEEMLKNQSCNYTEMKYKCISLGFDLHIFLPHKIHPGRPHCWHRISNIKHIFNIEIYRTDRVTGFHTEKCPN